jgi:hypothetical protein
MRKPHDAKRAKAPLSRSSTRIWRAWPAREQAAGFEPRGVGYFATTVFVAEPPRLLLTVMLPGFDGQLNSPR